MTTQDQKIFAFDVGKASLGICARDGADILALESLLIPAEYANTQDFAKRRRAYRTRLAHKKREDWLVEQWEKVGLSSLSYDDERLKREFPGKGDETLYNSALLRVALLQERPLAEWQIFKALWAAIQHRGYDPNCDWRNRDDSNLEDEKENLESSQKYLDALYHNAHNQEEFAYPCYLEASLMGLWNGEQPERFLLRISHEVGLAENTGKVRDKGRVAPREMIVKEIRQLFENAKKQLPPLQAISTDEFLFGPAGKPYASLSRQYARYRGTHWDAQGVLSQKVPRFDNRIINKCRMLPTRNVCKAKETLNLKFTLMMKLKNLRFTDEDGIHNRGFTPEEFRRAFDLAWENYTSKKTEEMSYGVIHKFAQKATGMRLKLLNMREKEKFRIKAGGRSSYCRPALKLLTDMLLSGQNPKDFDLTPYIQPETVPNPIRREELEAMVSRLGESWEKFHIGDTRYISRKESRDKGSDALVHRVIGEVNNPVVRHRLTVFFNHLKRLTNTYGKPDRVILEFVRGGEGLEGQKTASDWEKSISENEAKNDRLRQQLAEADLPITRTNLVKKSRWRIFPSATSIT
jgi:CRISPR-associated endonuclease Csn1